MKYCLVIFVLILTICLIVLAAVAFKRPVRPTVTVTLLGFTNDLAGTRFANFSISNGSSWAVERTSTYRMQVAAGEGWEDHNTEWFALTASIVRAEAAEIVSIPAATNNRWRVAFNVRNEESLMGGTAGRVLSEAQIFGLPTRHRRLSYGIWSNPIEE